MKIKLLALIFIIAIFSTLSFASTWWTGTPDFVLNETADFDAGFKINTSSFNDRYNQSDNTIEIDFPYAHRDSKLESYWEYNNALTDATGSHDGTITGTVTSTDGVFGEGYHFQGSNDYITAGSTTDYSWMHGKNNINGFNWTTCGWFRMADATPNALYYAWGTSKVSSAGTGVMIAFDDRQLYMDREIRVYVSRGVSGQMVYADNYNDHIDWPDLDNTWIHLCVSYDQALSSNNAKVYINGTLQWQDTKNAYAPTEAPSDGAMRMGASPIGAWDYPYDLDEIKVYSRVLTPDEIMEMYNDGKQYIDTTSNWTSDTITMAASKKLTNMTVNLSSSSATGYVSGVMLIADSDDSVLYGNITDLISDGLHTMEDTSAVTVDFKIVLNFTSDGDSTPTVEDIIGYYEDIPVILSVTMVSPINTSYCGDYVWINGTTNLAAEWCGYSIDGLTNVTLTNSSGNWNGKYRNYKCSDNSHNVTLYCNTTLGVEDASPTVWFWSCCCSETYDWVYIPFLIMISIFIFIFYKIDGEGGLFDHPIKFIFIGLALLFSWVLLSSLYLLAVQDSAAISEQLSIVISSYMWLIVFLTFSFMLLFIKHIVNSRNKEEE